MMRHLLMWLMLIIVPASVAGSRKPPEGAAATVVQLYKDFAWETVIEPGFQLRRLLDQPRAVLRKYFDEELTTLLLSDRACEIRTHGYCGLDFAWMWDSNAAMGATVQISAGQEPTVVVVDVRYSGRTEEVRRLSYRLRKTAAGWRIHDVDFQSDGPNRLSLATLLQRGGT